MNTNGHESGGMTLSGRFLQMGRRDCFIRVDWCGFVVEESSQGDWDSRRRTGPRSPLSMSGVSLVSLRMLVLVKRFSGGNAASPMMRLGQKFTTSTSNLFVPGFTAFEMSTRNGGVHVMPQD